MDIVNIQKSKFLSCLQVGEVRHRYRESYMGGHFI